MPAGGSVAAQTVKCPCGEVFTKWVNEPIKCPKEKRIEELESAIQEFLDDWENSSMRLINNMLIRIEKFKQLLKKGEDEN
jgi:hypothetical protein